jgi:hypothetical protein
MNYIIEDIYLIMLGKNRTKIEEKEYRKMVAEDAMWLLVDLGIPSRAVFKWTKE